MTTETIEAPRSARVSKRSTNFEKWGWLYMRGSGVLLVVLIFAHLFTNLIAGEGGVKAIDFGFVAGKWANPFWKVWDTLLLWLALIHGSNGMRTIVNDYVGNQRLRKIIVLALLISSVVLLVLGTLVVWTFSPCPAGALPSDLPSFCPAQ
ncbi:MULTISPECIES: succinate dehydrogenase hydrophobic membrane anchor subunit [unclassified Frondihabitans]|jgi:succinate dehydrogenase / fumarate reductase membrane anchor subunit|uniref:succinate dehydrogenase hydrophobic membrane anchor subunit n=1 Tax=unclassified Frondihabitans TaxID=2626248 RepID=UPI000700D9D5|nr:MULTISPECIES: succinate dehydrogenase hydrophobic membrane anchor subunit [unclassified Frondihabitans]KQQ28093.1 succinate dehydrogenase [Frondihabitans sp. Leaf304]MBF4575927.1 succinate dehydrogenase hydrophobic membrane anchor subunit [Frondihabitans sp. VKM Ac-2883]